MPHYRRFFIPGATYFFTLVTDHRRPFLCGKPAREILGCVMRECQQRWPFAIDGIVLLPDHLHCIWTMPPEDTAYPRRWGWIKKEFTKAWLDQGGLESSISAGRKREHRRGVWQPRFWEHLIRDDHDSERHLDYIHYNPVKHGLVLEPRQWPWSSFRRWVEFGQYAEHWGCAPDPRLSFDDIADTVGE